jgi:hypothetical protein
MKPSNTANSGKNGNPNRAKRIAEQAQIGNKSAIKNEVPSKVTFFLAKDTLIADLSITAMPAAQFDGFIAEFFADIPDIDRSIWQLAERLYAINTVLSQAEERKANGHIYLKLSPLPGKQLALVTIVPEEEHPLEPAPSSVAVRDYPDMEGE